MSHEPEIFYQYDRSMQTREWSSKMPTLRFKAEWDVEILPPYAGATVRFRVNGYSVYLDCHDNLGYVGEPYWEIFATDDCHRFMMNDTEGLLNFIDGLPVR